MISDTTIAATRTQGCELKDKFKMNFRIALPAAVLTIFLLLVIGQPSAAADLKWLDYSLLKVFPYIAVLGLALLGANVFLVLTVGIFLAGYSLPDLSAWHRQSLRLLPLHKIYGTVLWGWGKHSSSLFSAAAFRK